MTNSRYFNIVFLLLVIILSGCEKSETDKQAMPPVPINPGDECHVCGMIITNYPGPKGELYVRGQQQPYKYCSTRDLFSHYLQPEMKIATSKIYVHDMAETNWTNPEDNAFVDARSAWYVIEQPMRGAMGPTLASFANKSDAEKFVQQHGGRIISFDEITLDILTSLGTGQKHEHNMTTVPGAQQH